MTRSIVFEDEHILVVLHHGASDYLFVTFGDRIQLAQGDRFFADQPASKLGLNAVGFMAKAPNWFPAKSVKLGWAAAAAFAKPFKRVVLYGGSMGGYAAVKFSRLMKASDTIALCPQWSIDPAECKGERNGFEKFYTPAMKGMGIRRQDTAGNIWVFHDPAHRVDSYHARMIASASQSFVAMPVYATSHHVTAVLAGTENLHTLIEDVRRADQGALLAFLNQRRRASPKRAEMLLRRAAHRHPLLALRVAEGLEAGKQLVLKPDDRFWRDVLVALLARREMAHARVVFGKIAGG